MKIISVDFFGTLNSNSIFWKELLKYAKLESIQIHVISGPWKDNILEMLEFLRFIKEVHFDDVSSILNHLVSKGLDTWFDEEKDSWYSDKDAWWAAKAEICKKIGSHVHLDSNAKFGEFFKNIPTRFIHTTSEPGKGIIKEWHGNLKTANTYDDLDEYDYLLGGMYSM